jgi:hypothetical protein
MAQAPAPVRSADLKIDPPHMLYWANLLGAHPDRWICQMLKDNAIVEAFESQKRLAELLPCARGWRGRWMRYTLLYTWNCPESQGGKCPYWGHQIYGDNEPVPEKALLHHLRGGSVTCKGAKGKPLTVNWKAGDPWDARHQADNPGYQACGSIGRRGAGTHMIVNPAHPWTKESVLRYVKNRLEDGYSLARIDEVVVTWRLDWTDIREYPMVEGNPGANRARYLRDQGALLESMRDVKGWIATCPSTHRFWEKDAMILNAAGGCGSAEDFPSGTGLRVNWGNKLTVGEARAKWGPSILNKEPDHARPTNLKYGVGYDSSRRNIEGAAMMVRRAMEYNNPNLIWVMYCNNLVGSGETLQEAVGAGGDRIYCNDMGDLTDPVSGRRPVWYE